jgi:membrane-associated protease RseP (regulator of RpoE activity)
VGCTHNAARWPFQPDDRIVGVGSEREHVTTLSGLVTALRGRGGAVPIQVMRGGREIQILANPSWQPSVVARRGVLVDGALIAPIAFEDSSALTEPARLIVQSVAPGSAAEALGIGGLDIVQSIDGQRFDDLELLIGYLNRHQSGAPIRIVFRRLSDSLSRWHEFHVRDLPGVETQVIGPEPQLLSSGH